MADSLEHAMRKAMMNIYVTDLRKVKGSPASKIKSEHVAMAVKALVDDPLLPEASDSVRNALDTWIEYNPHTLSDWKEQEDTEESKATEEGKNDAAQTNDVTPGMLKSMKPEERLAWIYSGKKEVPKRFTVAPLPPEVAALKKPIDRLAWANEQLAKKAAEKKKGDINTKT